MSQKALSHAPQTRRSPNIELILDMLVGMQSNRLLVEWCIPCYIPFFGTNYTVRFCTVMAISRQKDAQSRDYALLIFRMTSMIIYSVQYHMQHCTLHAFEQLAWNIHRTLTTIMTMGHCLISQSANYANSHFHHFPIVDDY